MTNKTLFLIIGLCLGMGLMRVFQVSFSYVADKNQALVNDEHQQLFKKFIFLDPIKPNKFFFPSVKNEEELGNLIKPLSIPVQNLDSVFGKINIINTSIWDKNIIKIDFKLDKDTLSSFAYTSVGLNPQKQWSSCIIPHSGFNCSSEIIEMNQNENRTDIDNILEPYTDNYVLIKLNEDCLAIQDGSKKASYNTITPTMINSGSSYSYHYIVSSIALTKYLQANYQNVCVAGISQGGLAALINAAVTTPNYALVFSGYSVLFDKFYASSLTQIIYQDLQNYVKSDILVKRLSKQKTQYLFSYGQEDDDIYRIEAKEKNTEKKLSGLPNTKFAIHPDGHNWDKNTIDKFLNEKFQFNQVSEIPSHKNSVY